MNRYVPLESVALAATPHRRGGAIAPQPFRRPRLRGFTLIEALVVAAIIALLAAVLIPSLRAARDQARRIACQSNLRQLGVAWHMYLDAHSGQYPRDPNEFSSSVEDTSTQQQDPPFPAGQWMNITYGGKAGERFKQMVEDEEIEELPERPLNKFVDLPAVVDTTGTANLFHCPADAGPVTLSGGQPEISSSYFDYYGTSYRTNRYLIGPRPPDPSLLETEACYDALKEAETRLKDLKRSNVFNESKLVLMGDWGWEDCWNLNSDTWWVQFHSRRPLKPSHSWQNILFMDGHVEYIEIVQGGHVMPQYTVIPFKDLQLEIADCQAPL